MDSGASSDKQLCFAPYCCCVLSDQEKEQDLSVRTSKYVCFLHGEIVNAAEENGCTGFISVSAMV